MATKTKRYDDSYVVRCHTIKKNKFIKRCEKEGVEYQNMIRDMTEAYADGRLTITPTAKQLKAEEARRETYVNR